MPVSPSDSGVGPTLSTITKEESSTGIELTIRNLSLSVIEPPSLFTRALRKVGLRRPKPSVSTTSQQQSGAAEKRDGQISGVSKKIDNGRSPASDIDLRHVGINIFRNVDLNVKPGQGGSGSGKTTLLNTIAGRMTGPEVTTSGSILMNDLKPKTFWNDGSVGYLQQHDFLMPFLTVRETLTYAAHLRLPRTMSSNDKAALVELVLLELGLKGCANTMVGDPGGGESGSGGVRGISGGERRRVSAGVQLLTNPKMLLCDEVTSGLDAFSSYEVMKSLTNLAKSTQKTIVISIHQPRSEIFKLLAESDGQMALLSRGDVVYSGPVRSVLPWVEAIGLGTCPMGVNPFDFLLDLSMIDFTSEATERSSAVQRNLFVRAWADRSFRQLDEHGSPVSPINLAMLSSSGGESSRPLAGAPSSVSMAVDMVPKGAGPSLLSQIRVLTSRGWINQQRDSIVAWGCIAECIFMGLVVGAVFFQLPGDMAGIRSRSSMIYAVGAIQSYLMLMIMIYRQTHDIGVYDRERMDRWYGPLPHLISSSFYTALPNIVYPVVFSSISYYLAGLRTDKVEHFGWWILTNIMMQFATYAFATMCSSTVRGFSSASLLANAIFAFFGLSTGFFVVTSKIPVWLRWLRYVAYPNTAYAILTSNELTDHRFDCPYVGPGGEWDLVRCAPWDGNAVLVGQLDLEVGYYPKPIAYMLCYYVGFLLLGWVALTVHPVNPTSMGAGPTLMDYMIDFVVRLVIRRPKQAPKVVSSHAGTEEGEGPLSSSASSIKSDEYEMGTKGETRLDIFARGLEKRPPVTIRVEGLGLSVFLSTFKWTFAGIWSALRGQKTEKQLLKDVDVVFPAGQLTAILGGSGAGKTSLLNVLLGRADKNLKRQGNIYFNDTANPSLRQITSCCAYVRQDDNFLLSHLTVRETLQYAAQMNMDSKLSKAVKFAKVEEIIDILGLRECADVIVGSAAVKGISGGQRRRVSIGVQLVTEPACLFLDEPTSGLDALTAKAVVLTLKNIAASGRTVVCTIHQPRADIWHVFDNVVLLVTGGRPAYSGRADKVVEYFEEAGHVVPALTNTPDFILDTASINLRSEALETSTRKTVNDLIERFQARKSELLAEQIPKGPLGELQGTRPHFANFSKAFPLLAKRSFTNTFRQKGLYFNRLAQPVFVAIIMTIFFAPLGNGPLDVTSRLGLLQQTSPLVFAGMLNNVAVYPLERDIAYREISDGGYSPTSFFMAYLVNELPLELVSSVLTTVFMLVITEMRTNVKTVATFWLCMFSYIHTGESVGIMFSSFASHAGFNITLMSAIISVFSFMTGFLSPNLPKFLDVINHVSLLKYASLIMTRNEFEGKVFDCTQEQITSGACPLPTGEAVLEMLKFQTADWNLYLGLLIAVVLLGRLFAWIALVAKVKLQRW
ncbi:hypothetical protein DFQ26_006751 [Actinomortierella ambigua]|nr:hypothetical protein DFQ26_006751 [Actinomortierella ambigua]